MEQGEAGRIAEQLRQIQQLLSQALAQGAPQDVIDQLMQRYREAMQRYMQMLAQNPQSANSQTPPGTRVMNISPEDLDKLLKAIQQASQSGARGAAQQMLSMLQNLLENLHMTQGNGGSGSPGDKALSDAIQGLGDLMGRQRGLMDKTYRQQQGAADPKDGGAKGLAAATGQNRATTWIKFSKASATRSRKRRTRSAAQGARWGTRRISSIRIPRMPPINPSSKSFPDGAKRPWPGCQGTSRSCEDPLWMQEKATSGRAAGRRNGSATNQIRAATAARSICRN